jgi:hypothetical protein
MARFLGNGQLLYLKTGVAPTNPDISTEYTVVGQVVNLGGETTPTEVSATDRDGVSVLKGEEASTVSFSVNEDFTGNAGQLIAAQAGTDPVHFLVTDGVAGHFQRYGSAKLTRKAFNYDVDTPATAEYTLGVDGDIEYDAVPA